MDASGGVPSTTAAEHRMQQSALLLNGTADPFGARGGTRPGAGMVVTASALAWSVTAGAFVAYPRFSASQGPYICEFPATEAGAYSAPHASFTRRDILYVIVDDAGAGDGSGARQARVAYLAGTASASPVSPAVPARGTLLATLVVPPSGSPTVIPGPMAVAAGGILPIAAAELAGIVPYPGDEGRRHRQLPAAGAPLGRREVVGGPVLLTSSPGTGDVNTAVSPNGDILVATRSITTVAPNSVLVVSHGVALSHGAVNPTATTSAAGTMYIRLDGASQAGQPWDSHGYPFSIPVPSRTLLLPVAAGAHTIQLRVSSIALSAGGVLVSSWEPRHLRARVTLRWVAVEQRTGRIIADLPDLSAGSLKQTIGRYESTTATLPIPTAPDDWQRATRHGYAALIALDEDDDSPLWGGLVTKRTRSASGVASLGLVTAEGYLDGVYVGDVAYAGVDQNAIAANLVDAYARPGGLPFILDWAASATVRDRTYRDDEDATVYSRLTQLSGVVGGPEWTIGWRHLSSPERYVPVLVVRDRLGAAPPAGLGPAASFDMPGSVISVETVEDYSAGSGANDVTATGQSQGDVRPQSPHQVAADDGRPRREYRWSPSSSTSSVDNPDRAGQARPGCAEGRLERDHPDRAPRGRAAPGQGLGHGRRRRLRRRQPGLARRAGRHGPGDRLAARRRHRLADPGREHHRGQGRRVTQPGTPGSSIPARDLDDLVVRRFRDMERRIAQLEANTLGRNGISIKNALGGVLARIGEIAAGRFGLRINYPSGAAQLIAGEAADGTVQLVSYRSTGSLAFAVGGNAGGHQFAAIYDRTPQAVLSDDTISGVGIGVPYIPAGAFQSNGPPDRRHQLGHLRDSADRPVLQDEPADGYPGARPCLGPDDRRRDPSDR